MDSSTAVASNASICLHPRSLRACTERARASARRDETPVGRYAAIRLRRQMLTVQRSRSQQAHFHGIFMTLVPCHGTLMGLLLCANCVDRTLIPPFFQFSQRGNSHTRTVFCGRSWECRGTIMKRPGCHEASATPIMAFYLYALAHHHNPHLTSSSEIGGLR